MRELYETKTKKLAGILVALVALVSATSNAQASIYGSDLQISLVKGSTSVQLLVGAEDDTQGTFNIVFDDESSNAPSGSAPFPADMQPFGSLSDFQRYSLSGTWELHILDEYESNEGNFLISWNIFGTLCGGGVFDIAGPSAFNVDTDPATVVTLSTAQAGTITDINVGIHIDVVPIPGAVWLLGSGLVGLVGLRKKFNK
jgi:hypothetical protein